MQKHHTLTEIVESIKRMFDLHYARSYWIVCEIHKLNYYPQKGFAMPELVHKEDNVIRSEIRGVIWKNDFVRITKKFKEALNEPLIDNMKVLCCGKVTFHPQYGLSLTITDIDVNYSLGEIEREKKETLLKLAKLGILNLNQKLETPRLFKNLAIISAETSKGLSDFYQVLKRDYDGFAITTVLFQAVLQGENSVRTILQQFQKIESVIEHFDAVLIIRGGGGEVGLSSYNNYDLCETIVNFPIPVLTGIGHSTNSTAAEMISHFNSITPTALAELILDGFRTFKREVEYLQGLITDKSDLLIDNYKQELKDLPKRLVRAAKNAISLEKQNNQLQIGNIVRAIREISSTKKLKIQEMSFQLEKQATKQISNKLSAVAEFSKQISRVSKQTLEKNLYLLNTVQAKIELPIRFKIQESFAKIDRLEKIVDLTNPRRLLEKGYSITTKDGKPISNFNLKLGDEIETESLNYLLKSKISDVKRK